ncbi:ATP-dependent helicase [Pelotomaculum terephthalicicum JT]|uniref:UvrD-helicase domain-containing protein n=1 Tax=Pelotomaculum terephthalicicum TaxID=206393 RepID=UPI001F04BCA2|nr:ATP-dependent helicase [Pelotomaculum terephthalicicum]MCG9969919.1 ATP-dependent helicase [Pelotomaculum terephthalicicum JT]
MKITVDELINAIETKNTYPFDPEQATAIRHSNGPLWIIAGPGTGKTEVLVVKVLKLLCCDEIDPLSIIVTTYTQKAALNLENRIAEGMLYLSSAFPQIAAIDYCQLRIGTLHSLCSDIMQEFRYEPFQNIRLMDDTEQLMFIRQNIARYAREHSTAFRDHFWPLVLSDARERASNNLWIWTKVLSVLFNRIIEDDIDLTAVKSAGSYWSELASFFEYYENYLRTEHACDFSHLQKHFYDFLQTTQGQEFLSGTGRIGKTPIMAILVDEYQDTNPIQERIYLKLASNSPHNICVVGDDDQALFRFRGGTVDCMINFNTRCSSEFGEIPTSVSLKTNHRSNKMIIDWCNGYIESFDVMRIPGARIASKPPLEAAPGKTDYPAAVSYIIGNKMEDVAAAFAELVDDLLSHHIIEDYCQCVLILPSTRDSSRNAGKYISALNARGIPVYNPRAKSFLDHNEVQELLGSFISIIDPGLAGVNQDAFPDVYNMVSGWRDAFNGMVASYPDLGTYITRSSNIIKTNTDPKKSFAEYAAGVLFRIISFAPFSEYQSNPERDLRISKITRVFESFLSLNGRALKVDANNPSSIESWWVSRFYTSLCGYLAQYGMDDDEDDEVICPRGYLPLMTIHQSKGLEFDFVFAGNLSRSVSPSESHYIEQEFSRFRRVPFTIVHSINDLAWHDDIRLHYVTYSRAKNALVLLATKNQFSRKGNQTASFSQYGGTWFKNNYTIL